MYCRTCCIDGSSYYYLYDYCFRIIIIIVIGIVSTNGVQVCRYGISIIFVSYKSLYLNHPGYHLWHHHRQFENASFIVIDLIYIESGISLYICIVR